jgi:hypothetical protein
MKARRSFAHYSSQRAALSRITPVEFRACSLLRETPLGNADLFNSRYSRSTGKNLSIRFPSDTHGPQITRINTDQE